MLFASLVLTASAGTYTWTGAAGDGLFYSAGNWNYDDGAGTVTSPAASAPTRNSADDIVITNGDAVIYVPGNDWEPYGTVTISNGSAFTQAEKSNYMKIHGNLVVDGGSFDTGTSGALQMYSDIVVKNGGSVYVRKAPANSSGSARFVIQEGGSVYHVHNTAWLSRERPLLAMEGGSFYIGHENGSRNFVPDGNDVLNAGTIVLGGQMQPPATFEVAGEMTFVCGKFAPQTAGSIETFRAGRLVTTNTSDNGFWQNNGNSATGTYIDVPAGSSAVFTFPIAADEIYAKTFGSNATKPKFRYDGTVITAQQFTDLFTVEASTDFVGLTDFFLTPASSDAPSFVNNAVTATLVSPHQATLTATIDSPGIPAAAIIAMWGETDCGHAIESWDNVLDLGTAAAGAPVTASLALSPNRRYYYRLAATNEIGEAWASPSPVSFVSKDIPVAPTNTWLGTVSTDSRVDGNWSLGHVPTAEETVFVLDLLAANTLDWHPGTGTDTVVGWVQPEGFENSDWAVTFHTLPAAPLTITKDVVFGAGRWTHEGPSTEPVYAINIAVDGDFTQGSSAKIFAGNGVTHDATGIARGFYNAGPGYTDGLAGASYAGDGGCTSVVSFVSYGSILDPHEYGSSGRGDNTGFSGAGLILLRVGGAMTIDGPIAAIGHGWNGNTGKGASTGGTVNIVAGSLTGSGSISVDGGQDTSVGSGSGGRIAIRLTDTGADFSNAPTFSAAGRAGATDGATSSAAGTIYLQNGSETEGSGTVLVSNTPGLATSADDSLPVAATHLPSKDVTGESLRASRWSLAAAGAIRLTADARVASLTIASGEGSQRVFTDGHTLRANALTVNGTPYHGIQTADTLPGVIFGNGSIVVGDAMTVLLFR